jgi:hypothetical protein
MRFLDSKSHTKKTNFLCTNPRTVLNVFLDTSRYSAFNHVVFFQKKANIDKTIRGGSFVGFQLRPLYMLLISKYYSTGRTRVYTLEYNHEY